MQRSPGGRMRVRRAVRVGGECSGHSAGAALEADPTSEEAIAEALWRIHSDNELRADLRRRGLARAATMTPEASAAQWCALHEEILAG